MRKAWVGCGKASNYSRGRVCTKRWLCKKICFLKARILEHAKYLTMILIASRAMNTWTMSIFLCQNAILLLLPVSFVAGSNCKVKVTNAHCRIKQYQRTMLNTACALARSWAASYWLCPRACIARSSKFCAVFTVLEQSEENKALKSAEIRFMVQPFRLISTMCAITVD